MIYCPHDAPRCADCRDTGSVVDPRSADEDGVPDLLPCPWCTRPPASVSDPEEVQP